MNQLLSYAKSLNADDEIMTWLNTIAKASLEKNAVSESRLEHVIDWLMSSEAPKRLRKLSVKDAIRLTSEWTEANKKKGRHLEDSENDVKEHLVFEDGTKIVRLLTKASLQREGFLMSHCLGGYSIRSDYEIFSLRDSKNFPHATFEVSTLNEEILQIKGKGNGPIHPRYIFKVLDFLKSLKIDIRPTEMANLGYYQIPEEHLNLVAKHLGKSESIIKINSVSYLT